MRLEGLTLALLASPQFDALAGALRRGERCVAGVVDGAKPVTIAALALAHEGPAVVIVANATAATTLLDELPAWLGPEVAALPFPELGTLPYERPSAAGRPTTATRDRLRALAALRGGERAVVVASARAAAQRTIDPQRFAAVAVERGATLRQDDLLRQLLTLGYEFAPLADRPGTAGRRGGIVDVYAPEAGAPVRIEWLGDEVESLRQYDPFTQRSGRPIDRAGFGPANEAAAAFDTAAIAALRASLDPSGMTAEGRAQFAEEMAHLGEGNEHDGFYAPFVLRSTLLDHLPAAALAIVDEPADAEAALAEAASVAEAARREREDGGELPRGLPLPFAAWDELLARLDAHPRRADLARWATGEAEGTVRIEFGAPPTFGGQLRVLVDEAVKLARAAAAVVVVSQQAPRLRELLAEAGVESATEAMAVAAGVVVVAGTLGGGWTLPAGDASPPIVLLTDTEAFGFRKQRRPLPRSEDRASLALLSELEPDDLVVHIEHGIARFAGLARRATDGIEREYLELRYADNDRLFVPADQIDRVSRYVGPSEQPPTLTRLSSGEWRRTKERVGRAVKELAFDLLQIYAVRELARGHAFSPDTPWQAELEASFPYVETPDQLDAIRAVKADMERDRPMDRLVCGDVGYGKTEVAVRATFKAVMDGMQVAVLVPTTVLAQQHLATFSQRLAAFPVRVEMLSRFRSDREQRDIVAALREGEIDIVIGTHRLLQKDVEFKNLGLVIIDEEQRFGVAHKETLKRMRREVDVLTLTATPIPRTLHMALAGIRDMSSIDTPPEARQPVRTYVAEYDDRLVREAVQRELDRGGQVYFVHNRVHNIEQVAERLRRAVPEAGIVVGHGQMPEERLERVMLAFAEGEAGVLVCTTIIESGLDIPNVNTIIINRADAFGLAQLYQLRGRVGRSAARAYAYLLYDKGKALSDVGRRRLQAIFEAQELGAGFRIALRDLEIRGAGNLLGAEQSGQIGAVGFDLYTRMLAEAVERQRAVREGKPPPSRRPAAEVSFDLPLTAYLPESYMPELSLRLAMYQRLVEVRTPEAAVDLAREMRDRFGPLPPAAQQLVYVAGLRAAAQAAGVTGIAREDLVEGRTLVMKLGDAARDRLTQRRRLTLERAVPRGVHVGNTRVRFDLTALGESWQQALLDVVGLLAPTEEPAPVTA